MNHRNAVCARIRQAKIHHYQNLLQNADQSMAFEAVNSLLKVDSSHMLDFDSRENLCYPFLNFFEENIMKIRNEMVALEANMSDIETPTQRIVENAMTDICAVTMCEMQTIIQSHHGWMNYLRRC